jgi:hypothetical protein
MRVQDVTDAINAFPIHDTAGLEIRVVENLKTRFTAQEEL